MRGLYGPDLQIDLDQQISRSRVRAPVRFDFAQLGEGVIKNNMGLGGITIVADVSVADGRVTIEPSGQSFPLHGAAPEDGARARRRVRVVDPLDRQKTALDPEPW